MKMLVSLLLAWGCCSPVLAAPPPSKNQPKKAAAGENKPNRKISMVIEPSGQNLKIFLSTSENTKSVNLKIAQVSATAEDKGQKKTLQVSKQKDEKSRKEYFLISGISSTTKNLKIAVQAGAANEIFMIPSL